MVLAEEALLGERKEERWRGKWVRKFIIQSALGF